jgi:cysteine desulfurase
VDFLSASAHKFNGPKGIGFLFVRKGLKLGSLLDGGQQEDGRRAGTENVAAIVGMAVALKANCARMARVGKRLDGLAERLRAELFAAFPDAVFPGAGAPRQLPGFVSVALPGRSGEGLVHILDLKGIAVSAGAACDSRNTQVSHVLKAIRLPVRQAKGVIRISLGAENMLEDVRRRNLRGQTLHACDT